MDTSLTADETITFLLRVDECLDRLVATLALVPLAGDLNAAQANYLWLSMDAFAGLKSVFAAERARQTARAASE